MMMNLPSFYIMTWTMTMTTTMTTTTTTTTAMIMIQMHPRYNHHSNQPTLPIYYYRHYHSMQVHVITVIPVIISVVVVDWIYVMSPRVLVTVMNVGYMLLLVARSWIVCLLIMIMTKEMRMMKVVVWNGYGVVY